MSELDCPFEGVDGGARHRESGPGSLASGAGLHVPRSFTTQLEQLVATQPQDIQDEIIRINTEARPISLQVALLIPILAGLIGLFNSFRMMRLPDPAPSGSTEGKALG